jgi:hypothetical protein
MKADAGSIPNSNNLMAGVVNYDGTRIVTNIGGAIKGTDTF